MVDICNKSTYLAETTLALKCKRQHEIMISIGRTDNHTTLQLWYNSHCMTTQQML